MLLGVGYLALRVTADRFASWSSAAAAWSSPGPEPVRCAPVPAAWPSSAATSRGDLPEPDEVLRKWPELANDPQWAIYLIGPNDGDIEVDASDLTLAEAEAREYGEDDEEDGDDEEADNYLAQRAFDKTLGK